MCTLCYNTLKGMCEKGGTGVFISEGARAYIQDKRRRSSKDKILRVYVAGIG